MGNIHNWGNLYAYWINDSEGQNYEITTTKQGHPNGFELRWWKETSLKKIEKLVNTKKYDKAAKEIYAYIDKQKEVKPAWLKRKSLKG